MKKVFFVILLMFQAAYKLMLPLGIRRAVDRCYILMLPLGIRRAVDRSLKIAPRHPLQKIKTKSGLNLKHLGTEYGGWAFVEDNDLYGSTIISAGLGEDASFDVEFAKKYDAKVVIVDPTPRAVRHYTEIVNKLGSEKLCEYSDGEKQPIEAYDLQGLTAESFALVEKALWNTRTKLKFFKPKNPENVSHSIVNPQNSYAEDTAYIEVEAVPLMELIEEMGLNAKDIPLIKLDIEGAEVEVITDFLDRSFTPKQILVEVHEFGIRSEKAYRRIDETHKKLVDNGYECVRTDGQADLLYLRSN